MKTYALQFLRKDRRPENSAVGRWVFHRAGGSSQRGIELATATFQDFERKAPDLHLKRYHSYRFKLRQTGDATLIHGAGPELLVVRRMKSFFPFRAEKIAVYRGQKKIQTKIADSLREFCIQCFLTPKVSVELVRRTRFLLFTSVQCIVRTPDFTLQGRVTTGSRPNQQGIVDQFVLSSGQSSERRLEWVEALSYLEAAGVHGFVFQCAAWMVFTQVGRP